MVGTLHRARFVSTRSVSWSFLIGSSNAARSSSGAGWTRENSRRTSACIGAAFILACRRALTVAMRWARAKIRAISRWSRTSSFDDDDGERSVGLGALVAFGGVAALSPVASGMARTSVALRSGDELVHVALEKVDR